MDMNDEVKTRLVYESNDNRYIWESPFVDASIEDILDAFFGMMVSATWQPVTVIEAMRDFAEEHSYMLDDDDELSCQDCMGCDGDDECGDCKESEFIKDVEEEPFETKTRLGGRIATPNWPPEKPHFYA